MSHLFLFEPVFRETGTNAPCREKQDASDSQLLSWTIRQLEEPVCWLTAHGMGQKQPSVGRSLLFIDLWAGGLVLLGAECPSSPVCYMLNYMYR